MPPQTVTCSVCNQNVLKSQTYHVGNGKRACKAHEGVNEKAEQLKTQAVDRLKQEKQKKRDAAKRKWDKLHEHENFEPGHGRCGICNKWGIRSDLFATRMLIAMRKLQEQGDWNIFDPNHLEKMQKALLSPGAKDDREQRCLFFAEIDSTNHPVYKKLTQNAKFSLSLVGSFPICGKCRHENGLEPEPTPVKPISLETATLVGSMFEQTFGPALKAVANAEIIEELETQWAQQPIQKENTEC